MNLTENEVKAVLARLPREEKETMLRLPPNEAMRLVELHHYFPGAHRVDVDPVEEQEKEAPVEETPLATRARARNTDPSTSHAAAASIAAEELRLSQEAVLAVFKSNHNFPHGLTDPEVAEVYFEARERDPHSYPHQSPSGLRTRRREVTDAGLLVDTGHKRQLSSGRWAIVWGLP